MKTIEDDRFGSQITTATREELDKMEELIRKRVQIGHEISIEQIRNCLNQYQESYIRQAIDILVKNGDFKEIKNGRSLLRER